MTTLEAVLVAVGFFAGICNALVGGGTLFTFPVLIAAGVPPILANTTTTVALLPGTMTSAFAWLPELAAVKEGLPLRIAIALAGGLLGAALLLWSGNTVFFFVVPWLLAAGTILFTFSRKIVTRVRTAKSKSEWTSRALEFGTAVYGGYFGAAIGILLIASMAIAGQQDMRNINAQRNFLVVFINGIAALFFILRGTVDWPVAFVIMAGAILGGYAGARLAKYLPNLWMRRVITAAGAFFSLYYFVKAYV